MVAQNKVLFLLVIYLPSPHGLTDILLCNYLLTVGLALYWDSRLFRPNCPEVGRVSHDSQ